jgi:hypothetical protein
MNAIPLTQNQVAIVDDADYIWLSQHKWHANKAHSRAGFRAARTVGRRLIFMSRAIMGVEDDPSVDVDHINNDQLDNRRENLRICSHQQNCQNRGMHRDNKTAYKGVTQRGKVFVAQIQPMNGKHKWIGTFKTAKEAAHAYDAVAREHHGQFARLNNLK